MTTLPTGTAAPTRARYITALLAILLALIMYIDRLTLANAGPYIQKDLQLSTVQFGWALSMFAWAYALFTVPAGWLGDRIGPRKMLMAIVIWWSAFTAITGLVWNETSLVVSQTLFGAGEAGCFPNLTRILATWLPKQERERAQAALWFSTRVGAALTPLLFIYLLRNLSLSWRSCFFIFGVAGLVWAVAFFSWHRDDPSEHPKVNAAERALLPTRKETAPVHGFPLGQILSKGSVILLCLQYACLAYGWFFYVTWLPTYLNQASKMGLSDRPVLIKLLTGLPLILGGFGCLFSGWLSPRLARSIGVIKARRTVAITGFVGASVMTLVFIRMQQALPAMFVLGLAGFFNDFVMPSAWASTMDIGGRFAGTVSGAMNMLGSVAGATSTLLVGYLLKWTNPGLTCTASSSCDWTPTLYIFAAIYLVGAVCWLFLDPHTPIEQPAN
jgi:ACS family glucarate transporter-like MFS transporter